MQPASFDASDDLNFQDSKSGFLLTSKFDEENQKITMMVNQKILWSIPEFIGRRAHKLSHDGQKILLYGNYYFGLRNLRLNPSETVASIYNLGEKVLTVELKELYKNPEQSAEDFGLPIKGGPYTRWTEMIKSVEVDWEKSELRINLRKSKFVKKF